MIHAPICMFCLSPLHSQLLYSNSYCVASIFFRLSMSIYLQQRVNRRLKLFAFPLNVPKAVTIRCTWTALYMIRRLKYTTAKRAFLKFIFFSVLKGSCQLIANSKYAIVERQSLFAAVHECVSIKVSPPSRPSACCDLLTHCVFLPPPSSTPSRSLQRPRGAALPGKRPHAHVCQVSLHLPATSRCRAGVQSCTEGHAVSGPAPTSFPTFLVSSRPRKSVCCHGLSTLCPIK